jgi:DNA polymerase-3 subunit gamma/tau
MATYQVLARRYRPQVFADVIGQKAAVSQLRNEITEGRVGHGYLFSGPRGTGKTSMARIFAKALNCVNGPTPDPCGKCSHCQEIAAGTHLDIIEVDAATYTKVESTRSLLEGLNRSPFSARTKVYIIDEVHMLSTHSFNALLKSLEEPPPNVVFILATTNPEKIPETVVSRCRRVAFERLKPEEITRSLSRILAAEGVKLPEAEAQSILQAVALASEGGLRDAQVLLDQLISLSAEDLTLESVRSLLGVVESDLFDQLLENLADRNPEACLRLVGDMVDRGRDIQRFARMFLTYLRDVMIIKAGGASDLAAIADPSSDRLRSVAGRLSLPYLLNILQQFLDLQERMRGAAPPRFLLEFALIKLTAIDPRLVIDPELGGGPPRGGAASGPDGRVGSRRPAEGTAPRGVAVPAQGTRMQARRAPEPAAMVLNEATEELAPKPEPEMIQTSEADHWSAFIEKVGEFSPPLRTVMSHARLVSAGDSRLVIELAFGDRVMKRTLDRPESVEAVRAAARHAWRRNLMPSYNIAPQPEVARVEDIAPVDAGLAVADEEDAVTPQWESPAVEESLGRVEPVGIVGPPMTLEQAWQAYPEFRAACEMVEKHLGTPPSSYNGKPIRTQSRLA